VLVHAGSHSLPVGEQLQEPGTIGPQTFPAIWQSVSVKHGIDAGRQAPQPEGTLSQQVVPLWQSESS
jgi:hypothetical protein